MEGGDGFFTKYHGTFRAALLSQSKKIQDADNGMATGEPQKLPTWLRGPLDSRRAALLALSGDTVEAEGARRSDSIEVRAAFEEGEALIRSVSRFLNSTEPANMRPAMRAFYGLGPKLPISFRHDDIDDYLVEFVKAQTLAGVSDDAKLRPATLERINAVLAIIENKSEGANIGPRAGLTSEKEAAAQALEETIGRVRYYLWSSLPQMFKDPLLHLYGFVPRQESETERAEPPTQAASDV